MEGLFDDAEEITREVFDKVEAERQEQRVLLNKGFAFKINGINHTIKQPKLGVLVQLANYYIDLEVDEKELTQPNFLAAFAAQKRAVLPNAFTCAKIVAAACLGDYIRVKFLTRIYAIWFYMFMNPSELYQATSIIIKAMNLQDFINSIMLLRVARITAPDVVETVKSQEPEA